MDWFMYKDLKKCKINTFDDGLQDYENIYDNEWLILATNNRGKYMIKNIREPNFIIKSISCWKVEIIS